MTARHQTAPIAPDLFREQITLADMITEVEKELAYRDRVYPRRVAEGRMTQKTADWRKAVMVEVLKTLQGLR